MKKVLASSVALGFLLSAASGPVNAHDSSEGRWRLAEQVQSALTYLPTRYQTANVFDPTVGPSVYQGAAWLKRSKNGIQGRIMANVPTAGDPYTLWVVVFNKPQYCAAMPCAPSDIANEAVHASVFNGSGAISAANGNGGGVFNVDFEVVAGNLPNDLFILAGDLRGLLRDRGFGAEVNLVIDQHPSITPGSMSWISDLTTTNFPGGGPNVGHGVAIFVACPATSCPDSLL